MGKVFEIVLNRPKNSNRIMRMVSENNCYLCSSFDTDEAGYLKLSVKGKTTSVLPQK